MRIPSLRLVTFVSVSLVLGSSLPANAATQTLVPKGAVWKYLDDGSNQGITWVFPWFNDILWALGPAQLGYGDGDEATVVSFGPNPANKYVTTYFRHTFNVQNPASFAALVIDLLRDDGAVVYLNGTEVARSNMPSGSINYLTLASSTISGSSEDAFVTFVADAALLVPGSNTLAVEIHQRTKTSSDISFDLELRAETEPILFRPPYLQRASEDEITVRWRTAGATDSVLRYGLSPTALTSTIQDPTLKTEHEFTLQGLAPDTTYYYSVGSTSKVFAGADSDHRFRTAPVPGTRKKFRVWVLGDSGTADASAAAVRDAWLAYSGGAPPDLWVMLGDNAYESGSDAEYTAAVFDMYPMVLRQSPLWSTRGNHEKSASVYYDTFTLPTAAEAGGVPSGTEAYYSFDYANVHFICLDSFGSDRSVGGPMWTWLQADLQATTQEWIVAFWHHPPYSKGSHDSDFETELVQMRQNFLPLLESGGVDLVLAGHSHSYERSFLLDGHYGNSSTLAPSMIKDGGDGREGGDGPYVKASIPHAGAVYTVAGSSGKTTNAPLDHPAMFFSVKALGSVVLDFDGERLDAAFLTATGQVTDHYTLIKLQDDGGLTGDTTTLSASAGGALTLSLDAGPSQAGNPYFLLGSATGFEPGVPVDGHVLPLVVDVFTNATLVLANSALLPNSFSNLDAAGQSASGLVLPPATTPAAVGLTLYFAYLVYDIPGTGKASFTSNAFPVTIQP